MPLVLDITCETICEGFIQVADPVGEGGEEGGLVGYQCDQCAETGDVLILATVEQVRIVLHYSTG